MKKIKAGIIGGAGYTGGELLRLLLNHQDVDISFVHSKSNAGKPVSDVHNDLSGETGLSFSPDFSNSADVIFLCLGHGESKKFMAENEFSNKTKIIDLSQDFRINGKFENRDFIYGLPEFQKNAIKTASNIANPGCFATAIELALLPLSASKKLTDDVHISGITGSTGAGQSLSDKTHFSWRNNNISSYKVFEHQHLNEIKQTLDSMQKNSPDLYFVPYRGNFSRGILITAYTKSALTNQEANDLYKEYYEPHPFVHIQTNIPDIKYVVNTNKSVLQITKTGNQLVISSVIDNLLKGASGQAVQNMNLMFGLEETTGLKLKASAF